MTKTNRSPEFLADFPLGKVPTFRGQNGLTLFESDAIAQYIAECGPASGQLLGTTPEERAVIQQWIGFADHELFAPLQNMILWRYGMGVYDSKLEAASFRHLRASLRVLENYLQGRQYVATDHLNMADLSLAAALYWGFGQVIDKDMRREYPSTVAWYLRVIEQDQVKTAFGDKVFIDVRRDTPQ
jgi:elongation factor 1-gamma